MASITLTSVYIILILFPMLTYSLPFVVFHGISVGCTTRLISRFTGLLSNWSTTQGYCIEIGNGAWDSWFMPLFRQTDIACEKVKNMNELKQGYNIVGLSQGNLVGRGVLEFCDDGPPVKNFISLTGPHAGQASLPSCVSGSSGIMCAIMNKLLKLVVYSDIFQVHFFIHFQMKLSFSFIYKLRSCLQEHLAPANYIKIPTEVDGYRRGCKFLPKLNNEFEKNSTYKDRFSSLQNLVLIMLNQDTVLVPRETSWFGYYPDGAWEPLLPAQQTRLYIEDWMGLRTLDEAGKVKFVNVTGSHIDITEDLMKKYILPYLVEQSANETRSS